MQAKAGTLRCQTLGRPCQASSGDVRGSQISQQPGFRDRHTGHKTHLPAEQASGGTPLRQLMCGLAGRITVACGHLVQAHEIIQEVHLHAASIAKSAVQLLQERDPIIL